MRGCFIFSFLLCGAVFLSTNELECVLKSNLNLYYFGILSQYFWIMDDIDRKILKELQRDAQISMDLLSEKVHLSRNACWRRVKLLEDSGIIKARVALLDAKLMGVGLSVFVMIRTKEHGQDWLNQFERAVKGLPEIVGAHRMSGDLDYVLRVRVADVESYDRFYKKLISKVAISDISASFVMEDIVDSPSVPIRL